MIRGREIYKRYLPIIRFFIFIFRFLPKFLLEYIWIWCDMLPGILGVGFRYVIACCLMRKVGDNVYFGRGIEIRNWENICIGDNVSIHKDNYLDGIGGIFISNNVSIAHATSILSFEHSWAKKGIPIRSNPIICAPVNIEEDVWIGCGCRVLSGVTIGGRSIVAAGAVVVSDVPSGFVVAGVPAKCVKNI